jgi:alpha-N-arabinofuranosidase
MARSRSPWGPFEPHPDNPVLTHRNLPDHPFQALGHADLVTTPQGQWWATLLAIRPQAADGGRHHHIGRETLLAPVRWREDDWPVFAQNGVLAQPQPTHGLPGWSPWPQPPVRETFAPDRPLPPYWAFLRTFAKERWSLAARPGQLRLVGGRTGLDSVGTPAFMGRRQERLNQRFATQVDFNPVDAADAAGLALRMNESHHALLRLTGGPVRRVECLQQLNNQPRVLASATVPPGPVQLQVLADPGHYTFAWRAAADAPPQWQPLCRIPTHQLSTETSTGFTGVYMGLYAFSATATPAVADFAWVDFEALGP